MAQATKKSRMWRAASGAAAFWLALAATAFPRFLRHRRKPALAEILARMSDSGKRLKTLSARIEYTTVTVAVNVRDTESGDFFLHKGKDMEIKIHFLQPQPKEILVKKNKAEIYLPKSGQIEVYDLSRHPDLLQQFLLLGFGTEAERIKRDYDVVLEGEEEIQGDMTARLELTPRQQEIAAQLSKIEMWVSEESWLPVEQKFYETSGDYLTVRYTAVEENRRLPSSTFRISVKAKTVKMH